MEKAGVGQMRFGRVMEMRQEGIKMREEVRWEKEWTKAEVNLENWLQRFKQRQGSNSSKAAETRVGNSGKAAETRVGNSSKATETRVGRKMEGIVNKDRWIKMRGERLRGRNWTRQGNEKRPRER